MSDPLADLAALEGVPSALAAARDAADVLRRRRGRPVPAERSAVALVAGARASAELQARQDGGAADRWTPGALRMATELPALAAVLRVAPGQALARLHTLLAREVVGERAGRPREDLQVGHRLAGLNALLTRSDRSPALVLAAVVHGELASVAPFGAGDGVVARAAEHLVLIGWGIDPEAVLAPETGHAAAGERYDDLLAGYASGSVTGVRDWILHCARAVSWSE